MCGHPAQFTQTPTRWSRHSRLGPRLETTLAKLSYQGPVQAQEQARVTGKILGYEKKAVEVWVLPASLNTKNKNQNMFRKSTSVLSKAKFFFYRRKWDQTESVNKKPLWHNIEHLEGITDLFFTSNFRALYTQCLSKK